MTSIYPKEEKPNLPPTYEQATYYSQAPPTAGLPGMYPTAPTALSPQVQYMGMYSPNGVILTPPMGAYPISASAPPPHGPPIGTSMLITTQSLLYGDMPIQCTCPHCHQAIITRVERTTGMVSWLVCGAILFFGGWLGCCLIPFCIDSLKDTEHYCPYCAVLLGTRRRM